jgi:putative glycosyltransferase (TIGR04372 family)
LKKEKAIHQQFEHAKDNKNDEVALLAINDLLKLDPNNPNYLMEKYLVSRRLNIELDIGFISKLCLYRSTDEECFNYLAQKYNIQNEQYSALLALVFSLSVVENNQARVLLEKILKELGFSSLSVYIMKTNRIGHLTCEPDSWLRQQSTDDNKEKNVLSLFICNGEISNIAFFEILQRYMTIVESDFFHRLHRNSPQLLSDEFYRKMPYDLISVFYPRKKADITVDKGVVEQMIMQVAKIYATTTQILELTCEENQKAKGYLKSIGIQYQDKFVCLHVRDSEYLNQHSRKDYSYHDYRDTDIRNYLPAVKHLIAQGYRVIRIGVSSNQFLDFSSESYIDMSQNGPSNESSLAEIYLIKNCQFFIGTTSGPASTAAVFDTPTLIVNSAPLFHYYGVKSRSIFKHVKKNGIRLNFIDIANGLPLSEHNDKKIIDCFDAHELSESNVTYIENSPEEILGAVVEFEVLTKSGNFDREMTSRQKQYARQLPTNNGFLAGSAIATDSFLSVHPQLFNLE